MRSVIILCIILFVQQIARAQLNFEGNPLTEGTEYKAEESHVSGRNVRQDYQRFEVADGRMVSASRSPFTLSPAGDIATLDKQHSRTSNATSKKEQVMSTTTNRAALQADRLPNVKSSSDVSSKYTSKSELNESRPLEHSSENLPKTSQPQVAIRIQPEARQLQVYPVQPQRHLPHAMPYQSTPSQNTYKPPEKPQIYTQSDPTLQQRNANVYNTIAVSPVNSASSQALNKFLSSRTPEESQMALQHYLKIREEAARGLQQASESMDRIQPVRNAPEQNNVRTEWVDGTISNGHPNDEYLTYQRQENAHRQHLLSGVVPSKVVQDETGLTSYSPGQQYAMSRGDNLDLQLRQNVPPFFGAGRQRPRYRGQFPTRFRGRPWAQSRVDPRPFVYHHKGPVYGPPGPPPGFPGKGKPPVEVIYTRPPGFGHGPSPPSNPPVPYEDASHWFPDADEPPPHKDVYYSQLYQQSYDPHYYNYIAKTGKIKPWLYGKLGKHEEKSIWWELFAGFKKHGMKNMMNPMFLLGMTIPTLTFMLTALVQKKSLGRSDSAGLVTEEVIDELVQRIQQHIECYERQIKNEDGSKEKCW